MASLRLLRLGACGRAFSDERGIALALALGVLVVLSTAGASVTYYATTNSGSSSRSTAEQKALALAEAGLNNARATLFQASVPRSPGAVPQQSATLEGGTATWSGSLSGSTWTLVGTGTVRSPSAPGAAPIVRTVSSKVVIGTGQQGTANNAIWNYLYADSVTGCTQLSNSVTIDMPLYTRGDVCMSNSARVIGSPLQVGGTVTLNNTATIGSAGTPIGQANIAGGCRVDSGPLQSPCSSAQRVYASTITTTPTNLVKPPVDLAGWYQNANPGPLHACTTGSFPGGFDNDGVMNRSRSDVNLLPATAYDCRVTDVSGAVVGRLTWTPGVGSSPGTLVVAGTIFFDGDLELSDNQSAVYQGRATIYTSGKIEFSNNARLCGVAACDATWDANANLLAFVAGSSTDDEGFEMSNNAVYQGAVYAVGDFEESNSAVVWGPVIARELEIKNNAENHYVPLGTLLPGMPASYQQVTVIQNQEGSFSG